MLIRHNARMRNLRLDSLRGIAALCVVFHHGFHLSNPTLATTHLVPNIWELPPEFLLGRLLVAATNGGMAVYVFFLLSGCVLMRSLMKERDYGLVTLARFSARRILRIYPAMIVTVLAFALISYVSLPYGHALPFTLKQVIENSLLLSGEVNGGTWTLQTEMLMVPALLAAGWLFYHLGAGPLVVFAFWAPMTYALGPPFGTPLLTDAIPAFAFGMLIPTDTAKAMFQRLPQWAWWVFLLGAIAVRVAYSIQSPFALMAIMTLAFLGVGCLYHSKEQRHPFDHLVLVWLGKVSYSVYLIHVIVLWTLMPYWASLWGAEALSSGYLVLGPLFVVLCLLPILPLAALCEMFVEQPFVRLGQHISPRKNNPDNAVQG